MKHFLKIITAVISILCVILIFSSVPAVADSYCPNNEHIWIVNENTDADGWVVLEEIDGVPVHLERACSVCGLAEGRISDSGTQETETSQDNYCPNNEHVWIVNENTDADGWVVLEEIDGVPVHLERVCSVCGLAEGRISDSGTQETETSPDNYCPNNEHVWIVNENTDADGWVVLETIDGTAVSLRRECSICGMGEGIIREIYPSDRSGLFFEDGEARLYNQGVRITDSGTPVVNGAKYFVLFGVARTGWLHLGDWQMYFDPETYEAAKGFTEIDGKMYLFNNDGVMQSFAGTPVINGEKYWFSTDNGSLRSGWLYLLNWKMYFDPVTYTAAVGFKEINGKTYLFNKDGVMQNYAGTPVINGNKYWFSTDDASLKTGWLTLGKMKLYFNPDTFAALANGTYVINGKQYTFNADGVLVK